MSQIIEDPVFPPEDTGGAGATTVYTEWVSCANARQVNFHLTASDGQFVQTATHEVSYDATNALASGTDDTTGAGTVTGVRLDQGGRAYHVIPTACPFFKVGFVRLKLVIAAGVTVGQLAVVASVHA